MATNPADPFGGLEGDDRNAYTAILNTLKSYGLESLAPALLKFIQQGYSEDTINVLLQETDAYKQRFAANESRRQKGLPVLSPALLGTFIILLANALGAYASTYALMTSNYNLVTIQIAGLVAGDIFLEPQLAAALSLLLMALLVLVTAVNQWLIARSRHE